MIQLREQPADKSRGRLRWGQLVMHPLAIPRPLDQPRLTKDPQVSANAGFALTERVRQVRNTQVLLGAKNEQPQPAGFASRAQPRDQLRSSGQGHKLKDCTKL